MAQEAELEAKVSMDSILLGNYFELTITINNIQNPNVNTPSFDNFKVVGGPNQSSSISVVNGAMSQSMTYSYYLEPVEVGNFYIDPVAVEYEGKYLETLPIEIIVLPNPDGIIQKPKRAEKRSLFSDPFENWGEWPFKRQLPETPNQEERKTPAKPKKKKKIYKI